MFDRQLPKSRALISGTSSPRIILQRGSFNDINLYPCSCSKDYNHNHFFLFDCVTPKSWNCSLTKNPLICSFALYWVERGKVERAQGRCSNCKPREAGGLEKREREGGVSSLRPIQVNIPRPSGSRFSKDCTSNETP